MPLLVVKRALTDVLVLLKDAAPLDVLGPIYRFCRERGYAPRDEALLVGDWPVQFIPTFSPLTEEAVRTAETADIEGLPARVVSARHLAAIALSVGRAKDYARILALLESAAVSGEEIGALALRHGLAGAWAKLSWTEKLRLAVTLREAAVALRRPPPRNAPASAVAESRATYGGKKQ